MTAFFALGAQAAFAPQYAKAQGPICPVIGRVNARSIEKNP
jgi:hypothetical protein